jgi:hypothetical protein
MIEDKTRSFRRYYPSSVFSPERVLSDAGKAERRGREGRGEGGGREGGRRGREAGEEATVASTYDNLPPRPP